MVSTDRILAQCISRSDDRRLRVPDHSDAALAALNQLVFSFAAPDATQADLWDLYQMTQYLLQPQRDVYLGDLAPTTIN